MSSEIALNITAEQQALIDQLQLAHVPPAQLAAFLYTAETLGLDPRLGEISLIERNDYQRGKTYTVQVGIAGYRKAARRIATEQGIKLGVSSPEFCGEDGVWKDVWLSPNPPAACRVSVRRDGEAFTKTILWSEYAAMKKDGKPMALWASKPTYMLAKTAESLAYRAAFPDFNGTYEPAEFEQVDALAARRVTVEATRTDRGSAADRLKAGKATLAQAEQPTPAAIEPPAPTTDEVVSQLMAEIAAAPDRPALRQLVDQIKTNPALDETAQADLAAAGNHRWAELKPAGQES